MSETPRRKRRWFQFSLRSLLIFTALCGVVAGWIGRGIERKRRQHDIVTALQNLRGSIDYDYDHEERSSRRYFIAASDGDFFNDPKGANFYGTGSDAALKIVSQLPHLKKLVMRSSSKVTDAGAAGLGALTELEFLELSGTRITDLGLEHVGELTNLQILDLADNHGISDIGLAKLKTLTNLRTLMLQGTRVSGVGLSHLKALPKLDTLSLFSTDVGDEGVVALTDLPQLSVLYLGDTKVTDKACAPIKNIKQLKELYLEFTDITDTGVAELQAALPDCRIMHWQIPRMPPFLSERIPPK